ncbi:hypothetical protein BD413DRAFT_308260 [Trametes elegans]|nr:hypothetical protein BD413DRAFT_308260 [Trametes elegans]
MQSQDDPFHFGGTITSMKLSIGMMVTNLVVGYGCMDFLSTCRWDWLLLRGKVGCRPGAFLVYYGCRYLGITSAFCTLIFLDAFPMVFLKSLRYVCQITAGLSLGLAYSIFLVRLSSMLQNVWVCSILDLMVLLFWGIVWKVSTSAFGASLVHSLHICRHEHHYKIRDTMRVLNKDDVGEYGLVWAITVVNAVIVFLDRDPSGVSIFLTSLVTFMVDMIVACRMYRKMLQRCNNCPAMQCASMLIRA